MVSTWRQPPFNSTLGCPLTSLPPLPPAGCLLDLEVVVEVHCDAHSASLYPANAVRNRALRLAETEVRWRWCRGGWAAR